jgi:hypothetical protein
METYHLTPRALLTYDGHVIELFTDENDSRRYHVLQLTAFALTNGELVVETARAKVTLAVEVPYRAKIEGFVRDLRSRLGHLTT